MTQRITMPGDMACTYAEQLKEIIGSSDLPQEEKDTVLDALEIIISNYCPI